MENFFDYKKRVDWILAESHYVFSNQYHARNHALWQDVRVWDREDDDFTPRDAVFEEKTHEVAKLHETPELAAQTAFLFSVSDYLQLCHGIGELANVIGNLPPFFWLVFILLIYLVLNTIHAIVHGIVTEIVDSFGFVGIVLLLSTSWVTWPAFLVTMVKALQSVDTIVARRLRTVVVTEIPDILTRQDIVEYFERKMENPEIAFRVSDMRRARGDFYECDVQFETDMMYSLEECAICGKRSAWQNYAKIRDYEVRLRPKLGEVTSNVEYWTHFFCYLYSSFEPRYWIQLTLSIYITLALVEIVIMKVLAYGRDILVEIGPSAGQFRIALHAFFLAAIVAFCGWQSWVDTKMARQRMTKDVGPSVVSVKWGSKDQAKNKDEKTD